MGLAQPPPTDPTQVLLMAPAASQRAAALWASATSTATAIPPNAVIAADTLAGRLQVTNDAQASYALPLQVPIGINELTPNLHLQYRSTRANGIVGAGWQVSEFSSITRCALTTGQDDVAAPISDTASDRFCLDGQRLVAIQGAYGADGTEYRTEFESFARIYSHGSPVTGTDYTGPASFEVWTPDGRVMQYGGSTASVVKSAKVLRTWGISETRDRFNNTISFAYMTTICDMPNGPGPVPCFNTGLIPSEIQYGAHRDGGSLDPAVVSDRRVHLVYGTDRTDWGSSYSRGLAQVLRHRLDSIEMIVSGAVVWTYQLRYEFVNGVTRLVGVSRCGAAATPLCTPETTFNYASAGQVATRTPSAKSVVEQFGNGPQSQGVGTTIVLDANGDGRDDLVVPERVGRLPNGGVTYNYHLWLGQTGDDPYQIDIDTSLWSGDGDPNYYLPCFSQESVIDYNRDGKDDLVDLCSNPLDGWRVFLSTGAGFTAQPLTFLPGFYYDTPLHVADFNGDGWPDFMLCDSSAGHPDDHYVLYQNRGNGLGFLPGRAMPSLGDTCSTVISLLMDVDGDGVVNIFRPVRDPYDPKLPFELAPAWQALVITNTTATWVDVPFTAFPPRWVTPGFISGDPDEFSFDFTDPSRPVVYPMVPSWQFKVLDYNGDGLSDFLAFQADAPTGPQRVSLYVNTGHGFSRVAAPLGQDFTLSNYAFYRATVIDWNGDGRQDLVVPVGDPRQSPQMVLFSSVGRGTPFQAQVLGGSINASCSLVVADPDGDGDADLLIPENDLHLSYIRGTTSVDHLLTDVENGIGRRDQVSYGQSTIVGISAYSVTSDCLAKNTDCVRRLSPHVAQTNVYRRKNDGSYEHVHQSTFGYVNARLGLYGRGWLGFSQISRSERDSSGVGYVTNTTFDNQTFLEALSGTNATRWFPYAGHTLTVSTTRGTEAPDGSPIARLDQIDNRPLAVQISSDKRPFSVAPLTQSRTFENPAGQTQRLLRHMAETSTIDEYGNVTSDTTQWLNAADAVVESRTAVSTFSTDATGRAGWLIRCPLQSTTTSTSEGASVTRTTSNAPCLAPGKPTQIVREPLSADPALFLDSRYTYDRFGNTSSQLSLDLTQTVGRSTTFEYDSHGLTVVRMVSAPNLTTTYTTDPVHGGVLSETAPNGVTRTMSYDALSRLTTTTTPDRVTGLAYDRPVASSLDSAVGNLAQLRVTRTQSGGETREVILDALGHGIGNRVTGLFGKLVTQETDRDYGDRILSQTAPHVAGTLHVTTTFTYDQLGRVLVERRPEDSAPGGVAITKTNYISAADADQTAWNAATKLHAISMVQEIKPSGAVETRGIDPFGRAVVARDALGGVTQYGMGPFGLPTTVRVSNVLTSVQYDRLGRPTVLVDPDSGTQTTTYDPYGQPISIVAGDNSTTSFVYDAAGRNTSRLDSDGTTRTYKYDGTGPGEIGQLTEATTQTANGNIATKVSYQYQPSTGAGAGQIARVAQTIGDLTFNVIASYDAFGRLDILKYPLSDNILSVRNTYDASGHLTAVSDLTGITYWTLTADAQGYRLGRERFGDGTETTRTYQQLTGRPLTVTTRRFNAPTSASFPLQQLVYEYDVAGEMIGVSDATDVSRSRRYEYDLLGRLGHVVQQDGTGTATDLETFLYDELGNIRYRSSLGFYSYGSRPHAVTAAEITGARSTYDYDARGNQVARSGPAVPGGSQTIDYTPFDLPSRITTGTGSTQTTSDFLYDADQRRVYKRTSEGKQTWYVGELYEREQTATLLSHRYRIYAAGRVVAEMVREQAGPGKPITAVTLRYIHPDAMGSPDLVMDNVGNVVARPKFEPFGSTSTPNQVVATGFTGHRQEELGLIDMRGRYYDPTLGRFLTPDPLVSDPLSSQSFNRYSYAQNRPTRLTDPTGWEPFTVIQMEPLCAGPGSCPELAPGGARDSGVTVSNADPLPPEESKGPASVFGPDGSASGNPGSSTSGTTQAGPSTSIANAVANAVAGFTSGAATATATAYGLGVLAGVCLPCATVVGLGMGISAIVGLVNGGAQALVDSTARIASGQGTAGDFFALGSVVGGAAAAKFVAPSAYMAGRAQTMAAGSVRGINTGPITGYGDRSNNCANCAIAADAMLAGNPASALPGKVTTAADLARALGKRPSGWIPANGPKGIATMMSNEGPGARGVVLGTRDPGIPGHFFNVVNQNGTIRFLDGQIGGVATTNGYVSYFLLFTN